MSSIECEQWQREQLLHLERVSGAQTQVSAAQAQLIDALSAYELWLQKGIENGWQPLVAASIAKPTGNPGA